MASNGQFTSDDKRIRHRGRPHKLDDPDTLKAVAEAFADGVTREKMCEAFGVKDPGTVTRWRKDPRVKAEVRKLLNDRILRISSKTDSVIEQRLQNASEMTVDDLIKIRKEFGGSSLVGEKIDEDSMLGEAMDALEANPELLAEMRAVLDKAHRLAQKDADEAADDAVPDVPDDASELTEVDGLNEEAIEELRLRKERALKARQRNVRAGDEPNDAGLSRAGTAELRE